MPRPFSNGTQYIDWCSSNCDHCDKSSDEPDHYECHIQEALDAGAVSSGEVTEEVAKMMGYTDFGDHYGWPCRAKTPPWDIAEWVAREKGQEQ